MTKYYLPDNIPKNAHIDNYNIIINKKLKLKAKDTIIIKNDYKLTILSDIQYTIKKIINYGIIDNAGDICVKTLKNYGLINNVDLLIVDKGKLYNKGIIENYYLLYLLRAYNIINKGTINNYEYTSGNIFIDNDRFIGNKIVNYK